MSLKIKLTSTILAFMLILGLLVMGVFATSTATVNLGGSLTFSATNVFAKVSGVIKNTATGSDINLEDIVINHDTTSGDVTAWAEQTLNFKQDGSSITIEVTVENLATDRPLYVSAYDMIGKVDNLTKSLSNGVFELGNAGSGTQSKTMTIEFGINDKNSSLSSGAKYDYDIQLLDASAIKTISEQEVQQGLTFTTSSKNASVKSLQEDVYEGDAPIPSKISYSVVENAVIPAFVKDASGNIYSVNEIGSNGFGYHDNSINLMTGATNLSTILLPSSITNIGDNAFAHCENLKSITIPSEVTTIGQSAFLSCNSLESIVVDENNSKFDNRNNCNAIIETTSNTLLVGCKNTVIPETVTTINSNAFKYNDGLTSIVIPENITNINNEAFYYCTKLENVVILANLTTIGGSMFWGCSSLKSITIPSSVTTIEEGTFNECDALTDVYYKGTADQWANINIGSYGNSKLTSATKHYEPTVA